MLLDYNNYIAYICPYCGRLSERNITIFDIQKPGLSLKCQSPMCSADIGIIKPSGGKYNLELVCSACGEKHHRSFRSDTFWQKKKIVVSCPETMVDIFFAGDYDDVQNELKQQDEMYREAEKAIHSDPGLQLYFTIIGEINKISKENKVTCAHCGSSQADMELCSDGIRLECRSCGAEKTIGVCSEELDRLIREGEIIIT